MKAPLKTILKNFLDHVNNLEERKEFGDDQYEAEFLELKKLTDRLKEDPSSPCSVGLKDVNKPKNRYKDIVPYDSSRVILPKYEGIPGSDYINASYIKGASGAFAYIAAQGPLPNTVTDFWRMIWVCDVQVVVMACNEKEAGKFKCEVYWPHPGEVREYGNISIELVNTCQVCSDFLVRTFLVKCDSVLRDVYQFHYTSWPDHGVPDSVQPILNLVRMMRDCQASETVPMVVHCSAGCGRTGTICAVDYVWACLRHGKLDEEFSLFHIALELRRQRIAMIQTKEQYILAHKAVACMFEQQLRVIDCHIYENIDEDGEPLMWKEVGKSKDAIYSDLKYKPETQDQIVVHSDMSKPEFKKYIDNSSLSENKSEKSQVPESSTCDNITSVTNSLSMLRNESVTSSCKNSNSSFSRNSILSLQSNDDSIPFIDDDDVCIRPNCGRAYLDMPSCDSISKIVNCFDPFVDKLSLGTEDSSPEGECVDISSKIRSFQMVSSGTHGRNSQLADTKSDIVECSDKSLKKTETVNRGSYPGCNNSDKLCNQSSSDADQIASSLDDAKCAKKVGKATVVRRPSITKLKALFEKSSPRNSGDLSKRLLFRNYNSQHVSRAGSAPPSLNCMDKNYATERESILMMVTRKFRSSSVRSEREIQNKQKDKPSNRKSVKDSLNSLTRTMSFNISKTFKSYSLCKTKVDNSKGPSTANSVSNNIPGSYKPKLSDVQKGKSMWYDRASLPRAVAIVKPTSSFEPKFESPPPPVPPHPKNLEMNKSSEQNTVSASRPAKIRDFFSSLNRKDPKDTVTQWYNVENDEDARNYKAEMQANTNSSAASKFMSKTLPFLPKASWKKVGCKSPLSSPDSPKSITDQLPAQPSSTFYTDMIVNEQPADPFAGKKSEGNKCPIPEEIIPLNSEKNNFWPSNSVSKVEKQINNTPLEKKNTETGSGATFVNNQHVGNPKQTSNVQLNLKKLDEPRISNENFPEDVTVKNESNSVLPETKFVKEESIARVKSSNHTFPADLIVSPKDGNILPEVKEANNMNVAKAKSSNDTFPEDAISKEGNKFPAVKVANNASVAKTKSSDTFPEDAISKEGNKFPAVKVANDVSVTKAKSSNDTFPNDAISKEGNKFPAVKAANDVSVTKAKSSNDTFPKDAISKEGNKFPAVKAANDVSVTKAKSSNDTFPKDAISKEGNKFPAVKVANNASVAKTKSSDTFPEDAISKEGNKFPAAKWVMDESVKTKYANNILTGTKLINTGDNKTKVDVSPNSETILHKNIAISKEDNVLPEANPLKQEKDVKEKYDTHILPQTQQLKDEKNKNKTTNDIFPDPKNAEIVAKCPAIIDLPPAIPKKMLIGKNKNVQNLTTDKMIESSPSLQISDYISADSSSGGKSPETEMNIFLSKENADLYMNVNLKAKKNIEQIENTLRKNPRGAIIDLTSRESYSMDEELVNAVNQLSETPMGNRLSDMKSKVSVSSKNNSKFPGYEVIWPENFPIQKSKSVNKVPSEHYKHTDFCSSPPLRRTINSSLSLSKSQSCGNLDGIELDRAESQMDSPTKKLVKEAVVELNTLLNQLTTRTLSEEINAESKVKGEVKEIEKVTAALSKTVEDISNDTVVDSVTLVTKSYNPGSSPKEEEIVFHFPPPPRGPPPKDDSPSESFNIICKGGSLIVKESTATEKKEQPKSAVYKQTVEFPQPAPRKSKQSDGLRRSSSYTNISHPSCKKTGYENVFLDKYHTLSKLEIKTNQPYSIHTPVPESFLLKKPSKQPHSYVNIDDVNSSKFFHSSNMKPDHSSINFSDYSKNSKDFSNLKYPVLATQSPQYVIEDWNMGSAYGKVKMSGNKEQSYIKHDNSAVKQSPEGNKKRPAPSKKSERAPLPPNTREQSEATNNISSLKLNPNISMIPKKLPSRKMEKAPPPPMLQKSCTTAIVSKKDLINSHQHHTTVSKANERHKLPAVHENVTNMIGSSAGTQKVLHNTSVFNEKFVNRGLSHSQSDVSVFLALKERRIQSINEVKKLQNLKSVVGRRMKQNADIGNVSSSDSDSSYERIFLKKKEDSRKQPVDSVATDYKKEMPVAPPRSKRRSTAEVQYAVVKANEISHSTSAVKPGNKESSIKNFREFSSSKEEPPALPVKTKEAFEIPEHVLTKMNKRVELQQRRDAE